MSIGLRSHPDILWRTITGLLVALVISTSGSFSAKVTGEAEGRSKPPATVMEAARLIAEAPQVGLVRMSPDGRFLLYDVTSASVAENKWRNQVFLQELNNGVAKTPPQRLFVSEGDRFAGWDAGWAWCPDSRCLTYFPAKSLDGDAAPPALLRYDIASGQSTPIAVQDLGLGLDGGRPRIRAVGRNYRWSPSGRFIGFTAPLSTPVRGKPTVGMLVTPEMLRGSLNFTTPARQGLFVLDIKAGTTTLASPDGMDIKGFDWSPDEQTFAVTVPGTPRMPLGTIDTDVFIVDRVSRTARALVTTPGEDSQPSWSPDGRWIVFRSALGKSTYQSRALALVPAAGGKVERLTGIDDPLPSGGVSWTPDSQRLLYSGQYHLLSPLAEIDLSTRHVTLVKTYDERLADRGLGVSADGKWRTFVRDSILAPPEIYVQALPDGMPQAVTRLGATHSVAEWVKFDRVSWPSRDGKFMVHGLLFTPRTAWSSTASGRVTTPLPTAIDIVGGPQMVRAGYQQSGLSNDPLVLALHGYAVLVPNTRGREGYGEAFYSGMGEPYGFGRLPYEDLMAGVDHLVQRGIADPAKLAIFGHSYGGYLTSYTVTQTDRFRAAANYEGPLQRLVSRAMEADASSDQNMFISHGNATPFEQPQRDRLIAQSPAFQLECVSTPMLLLFGHPSKEDGRILYSGLRHFGVPTDFLIYDEEHRFALPTAAVDRIVRIAEWFDYWISDMDSADPKRKMDYESWKRSRSKQASRSSACQAQLDQSK